MWTADKRLDRWNTSIVRKPEKIKHNLQGWKMLFTYNDSCKFNLSLVTMNGSSIKPSPSQNIGQLINSDHLKDITAMMNSCRYGSCRLSNGIPFLHHRCKLQLLCACTHRNRIHCHMHSGQSAPLYKPR